MDFMYWWDYEHIWESYPLGVGSSDSIKQDHIGRGPQEEAWKLAVKMKGKWERGKSYINQK